MMIHGNNSYASPVEAKKILNSQLRKFKIKLMKGNILTRHNNVYGQYLWCRNRCGFSLTIELNSSGGYSFDEKSIAKLNFFHGDAKHDCDFHRKCKKGYTREFCDSNQESFLPCIDTVSHSPLQATFSGASLFSSPEMGSACTFVPATISQQPAPYQAPNSPTLQTTETYESHLDLEQYKSSLFEYNLFHDDELMNIMQSLDVDIDDSTSSDASTTTAYNYNRSPSKSPTEQVDHFTISPKHELMFDTEDETAWKIRRIEDILNDERRIERNTATELKTLLGICSHYSSVNSFVSTAEEKEE